MIFGRNKKPDNSVATGVTSDPVVAQPPVPPTPIPAAPPAPEAATSIPTPAPPPPPTDAAPAPESREQQDLRARQAMGAKMVAASFGEIVSILMRSDAYKHFSLSDLEWLVIPPVLTQQFVLAEARRGAEGAPAPIAVALWASVSEEVDQKLAANTTGPLRLRPDEWKSGDIYWLIDAVGPSKVLNGLIDNLHKNVIKGRPLKVRGRDEEGKPIIKIQKLPATDDVTS